MNFKFMELVGSFSAKPSFNLIKIYVIYQKIQSSNIWHWDLNTKPLDQIFLYKDS